MFNYFLVMDIIKSRIIHRWSDLKKMYDFEGNHHTLQENYEIKTNF